LGEGGVFINYRSADSHTTAELLDRDLATTFGREHVFLDCYSIPVGSDYVQELLDRVRGCRILLVVIGPLWLSLTTESGGRRIDDPADWIHREITEAFAAGVRVVPVLLDETLLPAEDELPADMGMLARCQAVIVRRRHTRSDIDNLIHRLQDAEPTLRADAGTTGPDATPAATRTAAVPRQLHAAPAGFVGREKELAELAAQLDDDVTGSGTVVISALTGAGGIGKTWLALHWAHQVINRFPDGQLFADLRGFSPTGEPMTSETAVRGFLDALGVESARIPTDPDAQTALYRSLVANKRMLIVLDNVATTDHVTPLLPGGRCTVVVTSRNHLPGLIARHGAHPINLDVLTDTEAHALLSAALGPDRAARDKLAITEIIGLCGRFPLALAVIAARTATNPHLPLGDVVVELRDLGVDALDSRDLNASLTAVLSWSLRCLTDEQRTLFGLLGIAPGPDITLPAVASLTALPPARAHQALSALEEASLVQRQPHGRYVMHDLVRSYAATTAHDLPDDVRDAALVRVMDFHLHTAHNADRILNPTRQFLQPHPPAHDVHLHPLPDPAAATAWLEAEHANLLATQHTAIALGRHLIVWHLAWALDTFHFRRGHLRDSLAAWQAALDAATHLADPATRSRAHRLLGYSCSRLNLHEEAIGHLVQALNLAVRHRDPTEQAHTHQVLSFAWERQRDNRQALDHARHALGLYRTLNQPVWEANALNVVGWLIARLGEFDTARDHCRTALTLNRRHHNPNGEAYTLDSLAFIAHHTDDHQQAVDYYRRALALRRALGDTYQVADTLDSMGHPHAALRHHDRALAVWREALVLYREQGRDDDAERVQQQLDGLDSRADD
jgi:tetratricopeptide (TPR) repeat protein